MAHDGFISLISLYSYRDTMDRLLAALAAHNMTIFARIDHAANAQAAGLKLRPTEVVIFGNAKGGTPLMQDQQTVGIDLPLKVLIWEDAEGKAWLGYSDPIWIARRHGLIGKGTIAIDAMATALHAIAQDVTT